MAYAEELVQNSLGRHFWIYQDDSFYQQRIKGAGPYQKQNLLRLRQLEPNARTVLDVGMNIGMNSIEYATWAKNVHGFEPTAQTYDMALRNIALAQAQTNNNLSKGWCKADNAWGWEDCRLTGTISTYNMGLGDAAGSFEILIKKDNAGHNHINNINIPTKTGKARKVRVTPQVQVVQVSTIDSFNFQDVDIIKVDTEGYEFPVVMGGEQTILTWRPVVQLEMVEKQPERFGFTCQQIYDWFLARDFVITLSDGRDAGTKWQHFPKKMERFFIHKTKI